MKFGKKTRFVCRGKSSIALEESVSLRIATAIAETRDRNNRNYIRMIELRQNRRKCHNSPSLCNVLDGRNENPTEHLSSVVGQVR
jgi:hypothetical protein